MQNWHKEQTRQISSFLFWFYIHSVKENSLDEMSTCKHMHTSDADSYLNTRVKIKPVN